VPNFIEIYQSVVEETRGQTSENRRF